jgi:hypothetical protein
VKRKKGSGRPKGAKDKKKRKVGSGRTKKSTETATGVAVGAASKKGLKNGSKKQELAPGSTQV